MKENLKQESYRETTKENKDIIIDLTKGIDLLSANYATSIQNFLSEYLGTTENPIPFGGRDIDLKYLSIWLNDVHAPPYLLIASPAGRGKSAFLVQWSKELSALRKDLAIVFIPISIRFNTNLASVVFSALTARLALLYGDIPPGANNPLEILRGMMSNYLSRPLPDGRKLVVILDGLDEAAGWNPGPDLFSLTPPKGLKIVVSARCLAGDIDANSWLGRLGWTRQGLATTSCLGPLTRSGVADILERMGYPLAIVGQDIDIVSEIHRLSEGDPLIVQLYISDLWAKGEEVARIQPQDLQNIKPGLRGFFVRWWEDQCLLWGEKRPVREADTRELLNIFACAFGPLSRDEILRIASSEVKLDTWTINESLEPLRRLVIGNGIDNGYVFSHPRLGSYFFDNLSQGERDDIESKFLLLGKDTLEMANKGILPKKPSYIVQYYGAHLERSNCSLDEILSLVSNGWLKAWEKQEGTYSGFLNDVDRAWKYAEQEDYEHIRNGNYSVNLNNTILCALCFASIRSLSSNIPSELLVELVRNGLWNNSQSLAYLRCISDDRKEEPLRLLSSYFWDIQNIDALRETFDIAYRIENEFWRVQGLKAIAPNLPESLIKDAFIAICKINDEESKASGLGAIAPNLPESLIKDAFIAICKINDEKSKVYGLRAIAPNLPDALIEDAIVAAREIREIFLRAMALTGIIPRLKDTRKALAIAREFSKENLRADVLAAIVANIKDPQEVLSIIREIEDEYSKERALAASLPNITMHFITDVLVIANEFEKEELGALALCKIAIKLQEPMRTKVLEETLAIVNGIGDDKKRVSVLANIAPYLSGPFINNALTIALKVKDSSEKESALHKILPKLPNPMEALTIIREIWGQNNRSGYMIAKLAPNFTEEMMFKEALTIIRGISDNYEKTRELSNIAPLLPKSLLNDALLIAHEIKDEDQRAEVLAAIAPHFPETQRVKILRESFSIGCGIRDGSEIVKAIVAIGSNLPEPLKSNVLIGALVVARQISDEFAKVEAMRKIAQSISEHEREDLLKETLANIQGISDEWYKALAIERIVPILPESLLKEAFRINSEIDDEYSKVEGLKAIASNLSEPLIKEALNIAHEIECEYLKVEALTAIVQIIPKGLLNEAITIAHEIKDDSLMAEALIAIVPNLSEPQKIDILKEALDATHRDIDDYGKRGVFEKLSFHIPNSLQDDLLSIACEIEDEFAKSAALKAMIPHISEYSIKLILSITRKFENEFPKDRVLESIVANLSDIQEAFAIAYEISNENVKSRSLANIMLKTLEPCEALAAIYELCSNLAVTWEFSSYSSFLKVLIIIIQYLPEPRKTEKAKEALVVVCSKRATLEEEDHILESIISNLSGTKKISVLMEAISVTRENEDPNFRAHIMAIIASNLPEPVRTSIIMEAVSNARKIEGWSHQSTYVEKMQAIAVIAQSSLEPQKIEILREAFGFISKINGRDLRELAWAPILPQLRDLSPITLLSLWQENFQILASRTRKDLLTDIHVLAPVMSKYCDSRTFDMIARDVLNVWNWWP